MNKNDNLFYNKDIINLFTNTFDNVALKVINEPNYKNESNYKNRESTEGNYDWSKMKKYFTKLFELLVNFDLNNEFPLKIFFLADNGIVFTLKF